MENDFELLSIKLNKDNGNYNFKIPEGATVNEVMFAIAALIKVLVRDGIVKTHQELIDLIKKYVEDEQYGEVTE